MSVLLAFALIASDSTLLSQAKKASSTYSSEIAKASPPKSHPLPSEALDIGSVWFTIDKTQSEQFFNEVSQWSLIRDLGVESLKVEKMRQKGVLGLDPAFERTFQQLSQGAHNVSIQLIGKVLGNASSVGEDFQQALKNTPAYQNLYELIEIPEEDWKLLPKVPAGNRKSNVPWLQLQMLHNKGYVPQKFQPYVKETSWNATDEILGIDGKVRRWIYLKEKENNPVFNFLSASYSASQIISADALLWRMQAGTKLLTIDGRLPLHIQKTLSLWIRKIGAYSASITDGSYGALTSTPADLTFDIVTQRALLQALVTEDARALQTIYLNFIKANIDCKRLVHTLQPFVGHACNWIEFIKIPKDKFLYKDEKITQELLKKRILQEDIRAPERNPKLDLFWAEPCGHALKIKDFEESKEKLVKAHLLLAFTYAMQPGAFSFSYDDLFGAIPNGKEEQKFLYGDLSIQMRSPHSFARGLQKILSARSSSKISHGELIDVLPSQNQGTLLLLYRLPITQNIQLLAINFSNAEKAESIESNILMKTTALDLMTDLMEEKVFSSGSFSFTLAPMSGRAFLFQSKEYD